MVVLNRIYTRAGDAGSTMLGNGEYRKKYDLRVDAYGTVDEVTAAIGVARLHTADNPQVDAMLARIQNDLFDLAADLCSPDKGKGPGCARLAVNAAQVKRLEDEIDLLNAELAPLRTFVLAGGAPAAAYLHLARTICRRAERLIVECKGFRRGGFAEVMSYINRLSDFCSSRAAGSTTRGARRAWVPGRIGDSGHAGGAYLPACGEVAASGGVTHADFAGLATSPTLRPQGEGAHRPRCATSPTNTLKTTPMVIPIMTTRSTRNPYAVVTWTLIAISIVVFLIELGATEDTEIAMLRDYALIPPRVRQDGARRSWPPIFAAFTYMFLHGGWSHIIGNMLFLWVLGDNIEDAFGSVRFFFFFLLCGAAGGIAHLVAHPDSVAPLVGASGAVAGVVAAYLMLRPCARITVLLFGFVPLVIGSAWVLGFWALMQLGTCSARRAAIPPGGRMSAASGRRRPDAGVPPADVPLFARLRPGDDRGETGAAASQTALGLR